MGQCFPLGGVKIEVLWEFPADIRNLSNCSRRDTGQTHEDPSLPERWWDADEGDGRGQNSTQDGMVLT